jgi:hypothetical protein
MNGREAQPPRVDNGLRASAYVPLTDVDAEVGQHLLSALGRARIAAYLVPSAAGAGPADPDVDSGRRRLFVASDDRVDARGIVAAAVRGLDDSPDLPEQRDPGDDGSTRTTFDAIVADWHVDTVAAVRDAERDLTREDADWRARLNPPQASDEVWLDDDHYVPPAPPPLPRLAPTTIGGILILAVGIALLALGGVLGMAERLTVVLGPLAIILGVGMLFSRLRDHHRDDDEDDGSAV